MIFVPELSKPGLDVVVLDRLEALTHADLTRLVGCIRQLLRSHVYVVVVDRDGQPIELSRYREVVSNDDYLEIILRDVLAKPAEPAAVSHVIPESVPPSAGRRHSRRDRLAFS